MSGQPNCQRSERVKVNYADFFTSANREDARILWGVSSKGVSEALEFSMSPVCSLVQPM